MPRNRIEGACSAIPIIMMVAEAGSYDGGDDDRAAGRVISTAA